MLNWIGIQIQWLKDFINDDVTGKPRMNAAIRLMLAVLFCYIVGNVAIRTNAIPVLSLEWVVFVFSLFVPNFVTLIAKYIEYKIGIKSDTKTEKSES